MNKDGKKDNLRASQPGNTHAEKSGVYSERRRTEKAREVLNAMAEDPDWFDQDELAQLAEHVALSELCAQDIAQRGVSDRKGNVRRIVGTHTRVLKMRQELSERIQAKIAASEAEQRHAEPFSEAEGLRLLRDIAHSYGRAPGASVTAIKLLLDLLERAPTPASAYLHEWFDELCAMSDEDLDKELMALLIPVTTGPDAAEVLDSEMLMRRLALQETVAEDQLRALQRVLAKELGPDSSETRPSASGEPGAPASEGGR